MRFPIISVVLILLFTACSRSTPEPKVALPIAPSPVVLETSDKFQLVAGSFENTTSSTIQSSVFRIDTHTGKVARYGYSTHRMILVATGNPVDCVVEGWIPIDDSYETSLHQLDEFQQHKVMVTPDEYYLRSPLKYPK